MFKTSLSLKTAKRDIIFLRDFICSHAQCLQECKPIESFVPYVPYQATGDKKKVLTYTISEEECKNLKASFDKDAEFNRGESDQSWFGRISYQGKMVGFYLGKSYYYETYWARFWLE